MISEPRLRATLGTGDDVTPEILIDTEARAVAFIEGQTGRYFGLPVLDTEVVIGRGTYHLQLSELAHIDSDTSIDEVLERPFPGSTPTVIGDDGFAIREMRHRTYLARHGGAKWRLGFEYEVTYERGYDTDHGPKDIEQLVLDLMGLRFNMKGKEGLRSETMGGYSYTRFGDGDFDAIDGAKEIIEAWRDAVFA